MTGIPLHTPTNQGSRRADDGWPPRPIAERSSPGEAGQGWARLTGREGEGHEYGGWGGGKQPSLQQEEEGGKEKERAKVCESDNETKIRE